jgi:inner membrane protein
MSPWIILGLLVFSAAVTVFTDYLAARLRPATPRPGIPAAALVASIVWGLLLFVAGLIATRYVERTANIAIGFLIFGVVAFALSLTRALLYRRVDEQRPVRQRDWREIGRLAVHNLTYLLFALCLYLALALITGQPADPVFFALLFLGALLPDLDSQASPLGRLLPFISRRLEARLGHLEEWHTLAANLLVAACSLPLVLLVGVSGWFVVPLGFLSHLILDLLNPEGLMLFWPLRRTRIKVPGGLVDSPGCRAERWLALALAIIALLLLVIVDLGPRRPPLAPVLSYQQNIDRYYSLRGRNLVYVDVDGTWQASGRRVRQRFEILNADGPGLILRDTFTGKVLTAGRGPDDNLYLNWINVLPGSAAVVKPVEVHLQDQPLADALPIIYEMQDEPGLQHIFVSGDISVSDPVGDSHPGLGVDYDQTNLRKVTAGEEPGHHVLRFLTAAELIELANVPVASADLVIVATYASPATGPTATPLPEPAPAQ